MPMASLRHYRLHPQVSSLRKAKLAAKFARLEGTHVLDPFCGTGTLLVAAVEVGAEVVIGSDLEDWSSLLRPQLRRLLTTQPLEGDRRIELHWGVSALDAVKRFEHDVLFTDPPNPFCLIGGVLVSLKRDFGISGAELKRMWEGRLSPENWMAGGRRVLWLLKRLIDHELQRGRRVILNVFEVNRWGGERNRDLEEFLRSYYSLRHVANTYYELFLGEGDAK